MLGTLLAWWIQLWPNLVADVLAGITAWAAHHRWTKRHTAAVHQRLDELHRRLDAHHEQGGGDQ